MLISTDWIKDFVEITPEELAEPMGIGSRVTLGTAEVEGIFQSNNHLKDITIVEIKSLKKHPEADKLNLVTFELGNGSYKEVVCGAPNVREGLKVPYAKVGVTLPNGLTLEPKKIRGYLSEGMLCSATELGLGEDSSGLLELPDGVELGMTMIDYLQKKADILLDIDNKSLTHRPDLWGHFGFAREFSALYRRPLNDKYDDSWKKNLESKFTQADSPIKPQVDKDSCGLAYWGISVEGVKVESSPQWMQERLLACGLRPINSIVDISNYVMLELGIPNHIFDLDSIEDRKIHIKKVTEPMDFETLDNIQRGLVPGDTVIADSKKPLVIAGIMGGANSGVEEGTSKIFIEVANWKAAEVRKTSTRLGLRTDSSQRYEKTLDSQLTYKTLLRVLDLVLELNPNAKVIGKAEYDGENLTDFNPLVIDIKPSNISSQLGKEIPASEIKEIFEFLDFGVKEKGDIFTVTLPSYRSTKDIECDADLVEEIGRIVGYDNISPASPLSSIKVTTLDGVKKLHRKIQDFMIYNGQCLEVMTYPMVGEALLKKASWPTLNEGLVLKNALSQDADRMRPSIIPSFLEACSLNQKTFSNFSFFEIGRAYETNDKNFSRESNQVAALFYDRSQSAFLKAVDTVEALMRSTNIPGELVDRNEKFPANVLPVEWKGVHPFEIQDIKIMGRTYGTVFSVHPILLRKFKIKGNVSIFVIDLSIVEEKGLKQKFKYDPLPKFPASNFDCTVVADIHEPVGNLLKAFKKFKGKELKNTMVADVFVSEGKKFVTIRSVFFDGEKTLGGEKIKELENGVVAALEKAGYPLKQG